MLRLQSKMRLQLSCLMQVESGDPVANTTKIPRRMQPSITIELIVIIILLILPLNILVIQSTQQAQQVIIEQAGLSAQNVSNLYMNELDSRMNSVDTYLFSYADTDPNFLILRDQAFDSNFERAWYLYFQKINAQTNYYRDADAYFVYAGRSGRVQVAARTGFTQHRYDLQRFLIVNENLTKSPRWQIVEVEDVRWLLRVANIGDFYYGAFIQLDNVEAVMLANLSYQSAQMSIDELQNYPVEANVLQVISESKKAAIHARITIDHAEVILNLPVFQRVSVGAAIAYLLLIPILILVLGFLLLRPLHKVDFAMTQLKAGNPEFRIAGRAQSREFANLYSSFNDMADSIRNLRIDNYEKELSRRRMELRNLQLQIRPHFLLNTFNLIFTLTKNGDFTSIEKLVLYLSDYFRYIFRSGKELEPFSQELTLIKGYLEIAAIRYPDSIAVDYQISEAALSVDVPPLLIHNFVENIINHAMQFGRIINIWISAAVQDGWACFEIADNGPGLAPDMVDQINNGKFGQNNQTTHIGLRNSWQRIRYFYGSEAKLYVKTQTGQGSCFVIRFPLKKSDDATDGGIKDETHAG